MTATTNHPKMMQGRRGTPAGHPDLRSTLGSVSSRPPRRAGQWVAAVLFVGIVALGLVMLFRSQSDTTEVLVVAKPVPAGSVVDAGVLTTANVSGVSDAVPAELTDSIVGKTATVGLVEGQVLTETMVSDQPVPGDGERVVAVRLDKGRVPGELMPGQVVEVLAVPMEGAGGSKRELDKPTVLTGSARVQSMGKTADGAAVVSILVPEGEASRVAAYSAAGQVTIVQAPLGAGAAGG